MQKGHLAPSYIGRILTVHAPQRDLIVAGTRELDVATLRINSSRHLAQVIHDTRGGALQSLLIRWEMFLVLGVASSSHWNNLLTPLSGHWFVETMDGKRVIMGPEDLSFG